METKNISFFVPIKQCKIKTFYISIYIIVYIFLCFNRGKFFSNLHNGVNLHIAFPFFFTKKKMQQFKSLVVYHYVTVNDTLHLDI